MGKEITMEVHGGMCSLKFSAGMATGPDGSQSSPGIGFQLTADVPASFYGGRHHHGTGVIGRDDARKLRDLIDEFFQEYESA